MLKPWLLICWAVGISAVLLVVAFIAFGTSTSHLAAQLIGSGCAFGGIAGGIAAEWIRGELRFRREMREMQRRAHSAAPPQ